MSGRYVPAWTIKISDFSAPGWVFIEVEPSKKYPSGARLIHGLTAIWVEQ